MAFTRYTDMPLFEIAEECLTLAGRPVQLREARTVLLRLMRSLCDMDHDTHRQAGWRTIIDLAAKDGADAASEALNRAYAQGSWYQGSTDDALRSIFHATQACAKLNERAPEMILVAEDDIARELASLRALPKDSRRIVSLVYEMAQVSMPERPPTPPVPLTLTPAQKKRLREMPEADRQRLAWRCGGMVADAWSDGPVKSASQSLAHAMKAYANGARSHADRKLLGDAIAAFDSTRIRAERAGLWQGRAPTGDFDPTLAAWWAADALHEPDPWLLEHALLQAGRALSWLAGDGGSPQSCVSAILAQLDVREPEEAPMTKPAPDPITPPAYHTDVVDELLSDMMQGDADEVFCNYITDAPDKPTLDALVVGGVRVLRMYDVATELRMELEMAEALITTGKPAPIERPIAPNDGSRVAHAVRLARACTVPYRTSDLRAQAVRRFMHALVAVVLDTEPHAATMALVGAGCPHAANAREKLARSDAAPAPSPAEPAESLGSSFADRVGEAAIRVAATQTLRAVRAPLVGILLRPMGLADDARRSAAGMLEAPGGEALVSALLSFVPRVVAPDSALGERVAQEFRVRTLVCLGEPLFDAITAPLGAVFDSLVWGDEEPTPPAAPVTEASLPAPLAPLRMSEPAPREKVATKPVRAPAAKPATRRGRA